MSEITEVSEEIREGYFIEGLSTDYWVEESEDGGSLTLHCLKSGEELDTYWRNGNTDETILNDAEKHAAQNKEDDLE